MDVHSLLVRLFSLAYIKRVPINQPKNKRAATAVILRIRPRNETETATPPLAAAYSAFVPPPKPASEQQQQSSSDGSEQKSRPPPFAPAPTGCGLSGYHQLITSDWFRARLTEAGEAERNGLEIEVLLIQRAINARDLWSGHMALPGGRCTRDESELDGAKREVWEEIGLKLDTTSSTSGESGAPFQFLGALPQYETERIGGFAPITVSAFGSLLPLALPLARSIYY